MMNRLHKKNYMVSLNVEFNFYQNTAALVKTSYHIPFDVTGTQNTALNFLQCFHANNCIELYHGRIYTCTIIPHSKHFAKYFDIKLHECEFDSIDIHTAKNLQEILGFLARPVPFCRYCNVLGRTFGHPWKQSKKEIEEWTIKQ